MNWFYFSLLSALFITIYSLLSRVFLRTKGDPRAFAFWTDFSGAFFLILIAIFEKKYFQINTLSLLIILLVAVIYGTVDSLLMKGRQLEEVSKTSIVSQTGSIWALLGGVLFLGESFTIYKIIGIILIVVGNLVILWKQQKLTFSLGIRYFFVGTLLSNIGYLIDKYMVGNTISPGLYKAILFFLASSWIFISLPNRSQRIKKEFQVQKGAVVIIGFLLALSMFFLMKGFQTGEASKVLPVYSLSVVFSVLAGILFLGEKERLSQKILGVIITFIGILILKMF